MSRSWILALSAALLVIVVVLVHGARTAQPIGIEVLWIVQVVAFLALAYAVDVLGWRWRLAGRSKQHVGFTANVLRLHPNTAATLVVCPSHLMLIDGQGRTDVLPVTSLTGVHQCRVGGPLVHHRGLRLQRQDGRTLDLVVLATTRHGADRQLTDQVFSVMSAPLQRTVGEQPHRPV